MPHRILLVANRTLGGDELATTVRERVREGATELWILVPATRSSDGYAALARIATGGGAFDALPDPTAEAKAEMLAERRLKEAQHRFGGLGIPVGGEIGTEDPFRAVSDVLAHREFDEVIVSTLPTGVSHWLRADLPNRVHRKFSIPVTTVTAHARR